MLWRASISTLFVKGHRIHLFVRVTQLLLFEDLSSYGCFGSIQQVKHRESLLFAPHSLDERWVCDHRIDVEAVEGVLTERDSLHHTLSIIM